MHLGFFFWVSINTDSLASKGYKGEGGNLIKTDSIAKRDIKGERVNPPASQEEKVTEQLARYCACCLSDT